MRRLAPLAILAVAFLLTGLLTSRLTLVLHEFVGHGGAAVSLGGEVIDHRLFLFGGGWVRYARAEHFSGAETIYMSLAGVGLEAVLGLAALFLSRRFRPGSLGRLAAFSFGALDLLHAGFYLATGTHHGFGDGVALHRALGDLRALLVWSLAAAVVAGGFFAGRELARRARPWLLGDRRLARLGGLFGAALLAAAVHGGLALAERELTEDPTYAEIMKRQAERDAERALARYLAEERRGVAIAPRRAAELRRELIEAREPFPLRAVLAVALGLAVGLGATAGVGAAPPGPAGSAKWRALGRLALLCAGSLVLVLILRSPWW